MKVLGCLLAIALAGGAADARAQCRGQRVNYAKPVYAGLAPYGSSVYTGGPYTANYAGYTSYSINSPFYARRPSYPESSSTSLAPRYGAQTTYFRAPAGAYAQPGGSFFGGYDYRLTYPVDWYAGNWTWW